MSGMQGQGDVGARLAALLQGANTTDGKREEEWKEKTPGEWRRNKYTIQVPPGSGENCLCGNGLKKREGWGTAQEAKACTTKPVGWKLFSDQHVCVRVSACIHTHTHRCIYTCSHARTRARAHAHAQSPTLSSSQTESLVPPLATTLPFVWVAWRSRDLSEHAH